LISCSDGVQNYNETGVDCGGPCPACGSVLPNLEIIGPGRVIIGDNSSYLVISKGKPVPALVTIVYPNGTIVQIYTNDDGSFTLLFSQSGFVDMTATQTGYLPDSMRVIVWSKVAVSAVAATSILLLLLLLALLTYLLLPRRIVVSSGVLKILVEKDLLKKYKVVYVTERVFRTMPELPEDKVRVGLLNKAESDEADRLADKYGIRIIDAETLVLGKKLRAKRILINDMPKELKSKYRIVEIQANLKNQG
jgi:predicted nucleic acid-binding protein